MTTTNKKQLVFHLLERINQKTLWLEDIVIDLPLLLNFNRSLLCWAFDKGKPNSITVKQLFNFAERDSDMIPSLITFFDIWKQGVVYIPKELIDTITRWIKNKT